MLRISFDIFTVKLYLATGDMILGLVCLGYNFSVFNFWLNTDLLYFSRPFRRLDDTGTLQWDKVSTLEKGKMYKQVRKMGPFLALQHVSKMVCAALQRAFQFRPVCSVETRLVLKLMFCNVRR